MLPVEPEAGDRRVRRSKTALLAATIQLISERGSTEVSVTELAEVADVSRRVLYQHFGSRDALIVAAAADLLSRELIPHLPPNLDTRESTVVMAGHMAANRSFYRAILTGSCSYATARAVSQLFSPFATTDARESFGLDEELASEVGDYFVGATVTAIATWLADGPDPLDPEEFAYRMQRIRSVLTSEQRASADSAR